MNHLLTRSRHSPLLALLGPVGDLLRQRSLRGAIDILVLVLLPLSLWRKVLIFGAVRGGFAVAHFVLRRSRSPLARKLDRLLAGDQQMR